MYKKLPIKPIKTNQKPKKPTKRNIAKGCKKLDLKLQQFLKYFSKYLKGKKII